MTTATITTPEVTQDSLTDLDFAQTCHTYSKSKNAQCGQPAVAFIEMHRVGSCNDDDCNSRGNMEGNVCQEHLDYFIDAAVEILRNARAYIADQMRQRPGIARGEITCPTCNLALQQASDILQKVIRL